MIRSVRTGAGIGSVRLLMALLTAVALIFAAAPATARAGEADDAAGYVMIGDTKVSKEIGITTQEELDEFSLSSVPKTFWIDPATGRTVAVELGADDPEAPISVEQAKEVMNGTKTLDEVFAEVEAAKAAKAAGARAVAPVTLYQSDGITTTFGSAGVHYGLWPRSIRFSTGDWYASADFTYKGTHNKTGVKGPGGVFRFVQGNVVDVTAMYMSR